MRLSLACHGHGGHVPPLLGQMARRHQGYLVTCVSRTRDGESAPPAEQGKNRHRLRGKPGQHFARPRHHQPGIGRRLADMADDAPQIVTQLDLGFPRHENRMSGSFQTVPNLDRMAIMGLMLQNPHPQAAPHRARAGCRHRPAAAHTAGGDEPLGLQLPECRPHRRLGHLQFRAKRIHPGQLAAPIPGKQPLPQILSGLFCQ